MTTQRLHAAGSRPAAGLFLFLRDRRDELGDGLIERRHRGLHAAVRSDQEHRVVVQDDARLGVGRVDRRLIGDVRLP